MGKVRELLLSLPWLVTSIASFELGWLPVGALCAFLFFLTALRQAHGAQHYTLGIGKRAQDVFMLVLGVLMAASLHALQATHMHHHRHCMDDSDAEAATARMPWWRAILSGPWFIVLLHRQGYRLATPRKRRWIRVELACVVAWVLSVVLVGSEGCGGSSERCSSANV